MRFHSVISIELFVFIYDYLINAVCNMIILFYTCNSSVSEKPRAEIGALRRHRIQDTSDNSTPEKIKLRLKEKIKLSQNLVHCLRCGCLYYVFIYLIRNVETI